MTMFRDSAEVAGKDGSNSDHEIVLHFHHQWQRRLELMLQLNSEKIS